MKRYAAFVFLILLAAGAVSVRAQAIFAATKHQTTITVGGTASIFQPDFAGNWTFVCVSSCSPQSVFTTGYYAPVAQASNQPLFGAGAYVDVKLRRWLQFEGEARWLRFHQYAGISQVNYLAGPRLPVYRFWKATVYAKALGGFSSMTFDSYPSDHGRFTDIAAGGGLDIKLSKRLSFRAIDVEYQYWPNWSNTSLSPYGASMGFGYKIF